MKKHLTITKTIGFILVFLLFAPCVQAQFRSHSRNIFDSGVRMQENYNRRKANGQNVNSYLRYHAHLHYSFSSGDFNHTYQAMDKTGKITGQRSIDKKFALNGLSAGAGTYFPIFNVSEKSIVAFNASAEGVFTHYQMGKIQLDDVKTYDYALMVVSIGLPLSLDLKYGGEAILDKTEGASFTVGAGLCPGVYISSFGPTGSFAFDVRPYLHADIGIFAGLEWKIQAAYFPGHTNVLKLNPESTGMHSMPTESYIKANKGNLFTVGIGMMIFSYDWEGGW